MIEYFIDSALIIDDKEEEIVQLRKLLEEKDIWVKHYLPSQLTAQKLKNRKIIFLDLSLDDSKSEIENISVIIRPLFTKHLGKDFGTFGIVLWTNHLDKIDEFIQRIQKDGERYKLPLFVVGLDKHKYLKIGFDNLFSDLNKALSSDIAANFFIHWFTLVNQGKDKAITGIYDLVDDYQLQNDNLQFILFQLAKNLTGIPFDQIQNYSLHLDAFKALNNMMNYEIVYGDGIESNIFTNVADIKFRGSDNDYAKKIDGKFLFKSEILDTTNNKIKKKHDENIGKLNNQINIIYSKLNSKLLLDKTHIDQKKIFPGNIYEIIDKESSFIIENIPQNAKPIIVEMTPPCDFSQKKMKNTKVLGGFISKYTTTKYREFRTENFYKDFWPLFIDGFENPNMILFDLRYFGILSEENLKDSEKYKIMFRCKDVLFADILQKLSSYNSRLGLPIIHT